MCIQTHKHTYTHTHNVTYTNTHMYIIMCTQTHIHTHTFFGYIHRHKFPSTLYHIMNHIPQIHTTQKRAIAQTNATGQSGLLQSHLPYIINYHERLSCFMKLHNRLIAHLLTFPWLCDLESRSSKVESSCRLYTCLTSYQVWNKLVNKSSDTGQC